ncbi:MAG: hypothetical protein LBR54_02455 [Oscillospiraceae bacterium]|jgi:hypothetical protein|nr:hypothetical protein [Oscillospiraceae bacterium]
MTIHLEKRLAVENCYLNAYEKEMLVKLLEKRYKTLAVQFILIVTVWAAFVAGCILSGERKVLIPVIIIGGIIVAISWVRTLKDEKLILEGALTDSYCVYKATLKSKRSSKYSKNLYVCETSGAIASVNWAHHIAAAKGDDILVVGFRGVSKRIGIVYRKL